MGAPKLLMIELLKKCKPQNTSGSLSQRNKRILRTERDGSDDGEGRFFLKQKEVLMDVAQS